MRRRFRPKGLAFALALAHASAGCAQTPPPANGAVPASASADTLAAGLVPAGFGKLRQEQIAIELRLPDLIARLIPLDESVIRTLSPDSYRALREFSESRRPALTRLIAQHGLLRGNVWYVSFYGLAPDVRFSPLELTITSSGRDFRPLELIPLTGGFGEQRLQPRDTQHALYLFEDALQLNQPLVVSMGNVRNDRWKDILITRVEPERAAIRSRAQGRTQP